MLKHLNPKYFLDREEAAKQLYDVIPRDLFSADETIVIALSEGGVLIAEYIAQQFGVPLDILLIESVLAPNNPELAIAKVSETQEIVIHSALTEAFDIDEAFVYNEAKRVYDDKILSHLYKYRKGGTLHAVSGKAVLLVDECIETDFTAVVAIKSMIGKGAKNIYVATPVMDLFSCESLIQISDGIFCPHRIQDYISIEYYYENLERPAFSELERIIHRDK